MSSIENIRTLTDLGLKSSQAKIYLTLLAFGPTSISKLALASRVARPDTYRVLCELQELGIVSKIVASRTEVKPLPIEDAISILMLRKTKENLDLSKRANTLVGAIKKQTNEEKPTENNQFALIQGDAIDFEKQRSMVESKKTVCVIGSSRKVLQGIINYHKAFLDALRRKVNIQIVTEELHGLDPPKKIKDLQKFPNFEWRYLLDTPVVWLKIYDNQKILLTTSKDEPLNQSAVLTNNSFLVELSQTYFNSAWFSAIETQEQKFKHDSRQFDYLFSNLTNAFTYCKVIFGAQGEPVDFVVLETNKAFVEKSKIGKNFLGERASKILSSESWKNFIALLGKHWSTISSGKSVGFEYFSADLKKWFSVLSYSPENGYFACIFEDITDQKNALELLRQSEEKFRTLAEESPNMIFINMGGRVVYVNKRCEEILGYKKEEFYQADFNYLDLIDTEYKHIIASNFAKHYKGEEVKPLELTIFSKEGKRVETLLITKLIKYGKETAILGTSVDISERLKKESELRQERDKLEAVTRTTGVGLSMIGLDFQVLWINRVLEEHFGDVKGQKCYSAFHSRNIPCVDCGVKRIFQEGAPHVSREMCVEDSDGRKETAEITSVPFKNDKGQVVAALVTWVDITERKKAEEALRESETNYRNLINGMNETAWVFDFNGNFVEVNDAAVKTLGYSRGELLTMGLKDIDKAFSKEEFKNHLKSMPAVGSKVFEAVHTARDGTEIPVEISSSLITYHGEQAKLSIARNITERKKAKETLKESEARFRSLYESSFDAILLTRPDGPILAANPAACRMFGMSEKEIVKAGRAGIVVMDQRAEAAIAERAKTGKVKAELTLRRKDGSTFEGETTSNIFKDAGGINKTSMIARDITERKKAEEALKESEELFSKAFQSSPAMLTITRVSDNRIIDVNDAFLKLLEFTREEVIGHTSEELHLIPDYESREKMVSKVLKQGRIRNHELIYQTKTGKKLTLLASVELVNIHGELHLLASHLDATDHKPIAEKADA